MLFNSVSSTLNKLIDDNFFPHTRVKTPNMLQFQYFSNKVVLPTLFIFVNNTEQNCLA